MTIPTERMLITDEVGFAVSLQEFFDDVKAINQQNGWYEANRNALESFALLTTEGAEAVEEWRVNAPDHIREDGKPEGMLSEFADIMIRLADWIDREGYTAEDLVKMLVKKSNYNITRGHKHGGKRA